MIAPVLAMLLALAPAAPEPAAPETARAVARVSYWSTRPGKDTEARAFWKPFAGVFAEMKAKGVLLDWRFVSPAVHLGEDWDLAYIWVCADEAAYGRADDYFNAAVAKLDPAKIEGDFNATFDGSRHRDDLLVVDGAAGLIGDAPLLALTFGTARPGQERRAVEVLRGSGHGVLTPLLHGDRPFTAGTAAAFKDMEAWGQAARTSPATDPDVFDPQKQRDLLLRTVDLKD